MMLLDLFLFSKIRHRAYSMIKGCHYIVRANSLISFCHKKLTRHCPFLDIGKFLVVHGKIRYCCPTADLQTSVLAGVQCGNFHLQPGGGGHLIILMICMWIVSHQSNIHLAKSISKTLQSSEKILLKILKNLIVRNYTSKFTRNQIFAYKSIKVFIHETRAAYVKVC